MVFQEDKDLYSINFLHDGEPKYWYGIPPEHADKFEALFRRLFPKENGACAEFIRHKVWYVCPAPNTGPVRTWRRGKHAHNM